MLCDTTAEDVRSQTDDGLYLTVSDDGVWQDAAHVWHGGRPDCLKGTGANVGPVTLGVVEGGDDGMAWRQVVWVGCPQPPGLVAHRQGRAHSGMCGRLSEVRSNDASGRKSRSALGGMTSPSRTMHFPGCGLRR